MKTKMDFPNINERKPEGLREDGEPFRVLVVDDSMFVTKQIGQILTSEGFDVVATASDGIEGVDKDKELYPNLDLVTLDITMPKMDGLAALRSIMELDPAARVIMCSALGQQQLMVQALQLGAKDFIVKPFRPERVLESIKRTLDIA